MRPRDMNRDWIATASTLSQALPYLQRYEGATVVIKLGAHALGNDEAMETFAREVVLLSQVGVQVKSTLGAVSGYAGELLHGVKINLRPFAGEMCLSFNKVHSNSWLISIGNTVFNACFICSQFH